MNAVVSDLTKTVERLNLLLSWAERDDRFVEVSTLKTEIERINKAIASLKES